MVSNNLFGIQADRRAANDSGGFKVPGEDDT